MTVASVYNPDYERQRLEDVFFKKYGGMLRAVHGLLERGLSLRPSTLDNVALRHILLESRARAVVVDARTQFAIAAVLAEGTRRGLTPLEIANGTDDFPGIDGLFTQTWARRGETIARTELQNAALVASVDRFRASKRIGYVVAHDGDFDAPCQARNGRVYPLSNPPQLLHPNCLVGGQMVWAPNRQAGSTRYYNGEVVILRTATNDLLAATPNHPVLSERGWLKIGQLRNGDRVMRCFDAQRLVMMLDPNHDHRPAMIEQVANLLGPTSHRTTAPVPTTAKDFHGDGRYGYVNVVRADGVPKLNVLELRRRMLLNQRGQVSIQWANADTVSLPAYGAPLQSFDGFNTSATRSMSSSGQQRALVGRGAPHPQAHVLTNRPRQALLSEPAADRALSNTGLLRDLQAAQLLDYVEVTEVSRRLTNGHVYNLQTAQGWYIAQNIVTHNCRLTISPSGGP